MFSDSVAKLRIDDGTQFIGSSSSLSKPCYGEIVFNTAMTGYQEVISDPSYAGQIVVFASPHVGNVGVNRCDDESFVPKVRGIVVKELSRLTSSWRAQGSLMDYLDKHNIPWIEGVDTRMLIKHLRGKKSLLGFIEVGNGKSPIGVKGETGREPLYYDVCCKNAFEWKKNPPDVNSSSYRIAVIDFGVKHNILKSLSNLRCDVKVFPPASSLENIEEWSPHGIVLSNGPGDPQDANSVFETVRRLISKRYPMLGICFGCQLLGLILGGTTKKMRVGHHGINHPVVDLRTEKVYISSQNHNYVIDESSLPSKLRITHRSLFDNTIQGIMYEEYPVFGIQGHPEGSPGPQDLYYCFEDFLSHVRLFSLNLVRESVCR